MYSNSGKVMKILWMVLFVASVVVVYLLTSKFLKTQAVTGCMQVARLETKTSKGETVTIPENYWYDQCMSETGFK